MELCNCPWCNSIDTVAFADDREIGKQYIVVCLSCNTRLGAADAVEKWNKLYLERHHD